MGAIIETRTKLLDIPEAVADIHFAVINEDYEDLGVLRDLISKIWQDNTHRFRGSFVRALNRHLKKVEISDQEDLNGFFSSIIGDEALKYEVLN